MTEGATAEHGSYLQRTPYVFPGYSINGFRCAACGHTWYGMALVGTVGVECPECHRTEETFIWTANEPEFAHDGAWLTSHWDLPMFTPATVTPDLRLAEDDPDLDPETGEPRFWLWRWLLRLQSAWWALKGEW